MSGRAFGRAATSRLATLDVARGESAWTEVADVGELMAHGIPLSLQGWIV